MLFTEGSNDVRRRPKESQTNAKRKSKRMFKEYIIHYRPELISSRPELISYRPELISSRPELISLRFNGGRGTKWSELHAVTTDT